MGQVTRTNFGCSKITQFSNAAIKALADATVNLVEAIPGAVLWPHVVTFILSPWVADYTNLDGAGNVNVNVGTAYTPPTFTLAGLLAQGHANYVACEYGREYDFTPKNLADAMNKPITLNLDNNGSGLFTGGNATTVLTVQVFYEILRIPA